MTMQRWRNKKRGTTYDEVGTARLQVRDGASLRDMEEMIVYRGGDGQLWVRSALEFHDGRFEVLRPPAAEELEQILNSESTEPVTVNPDGSITSG